MDHRKYTVIYEPAKEGGFYAHIPALDVTTEGETLAEAKEMARDAIKGYCESLIKDGLKPPKDVKPLRKQIRIAI